MKIRRPAPGQLRLTDQHAANSQPFSPTPQFRQTVRLSIPVLLAFTAQSQTTELHTFLGQKRLDSPRRRTAHAAMDPDKPQWPDIERNLYGAVRLFSGVRALTDSLVPPASPYTDRTTAVCRRLVHRRSADNRSSRLRQRTFTGFVHRPLRQRPPSGL